MPEESASFPASVVSTARIPTQTKPIFSGAKLMGRRCGKNGRFAGKGRLFRYKEPVAENDAARYRWSPVDTQPNHRTEREKSCLIPRLG